MYTLPSSPQRFPSESRTNPGLHSHLKEPALFTHLRSHPPLPRAHSFISSVCGGGGGGGEHGERKLFANPAFASNANNYMTCVMPPRVNFYKKNGAPKVSM